MSYSVKNLLDKNPAQVSAVVMAGVNLPILAGTWDPSVEFVSGLNLFVGSVLGLFFVSKTVNRAGLEEVDTSVGLAWDEGEKIGFDDAVVLAHEVEVQALSKAMSWRDAVTPTPVKKVATKAAKKK